MPATFSVEDGWLCNPDANSGGCRGSRSVLKFEVDAAVLHGNCTIYLQTNALKGMALVFGGQSTRGLLYLHASIQFHRAIATVVLLCSRETSTTIE